MRRSLFILLLCLLLTGCGSPAEPTESISAPAQNVQMGNPWTDYESLEAAEAACGLNFPLEKVVADSYVSESYRVLNGELLEVTYRDHNFEVTVRMQSGEGQDLSGVYEVFENISTFETEGYTVTNKPIKTGGLLQLVWAEGYSYSFYAPNHYWGDSNAEFLSFLNK